MQIYEILQQFLSTAFGNAPKTFYALLALVGLDYITGVCVAIREKMISSEIGSKGIARKIMLFTIVALSCIIDQFLVGSGNALCSLTILFYCVNEIFSILENANRVGLPLPKKLVGFLKDLKSRIDA